MRTTASKSCCSFACFHSRRARLRLPQGLDHRRRGLAQPRYCTPSSRGEKGPQEGLGLVDVEILTESDLMGGSSQLRTALLRLAH